MTSSCRPAQTLLVLVLSGVLVASAIAAPSEVAALRVLDGRVEPPTRLVLDGSPPLEIDAEAGLGYRLVASGSFQLVLAAAPEEDGRPARAIARQGLELGAGTYTTVVVLDRPVEAVTPAPPGVGPVEIVTLVLADTLEALPPAGHAALRLVHAAPSAGPATVDIRPAEPPPGVSAVPPPVAVDATSLALDPLAAAATEPLPAGAYDLVVTTATGAAEPVLLELGPGIAYTLLITRVQEGVAAVVLYVDGAAPTPPHLVRGRP